MFHQNLRTIGMTLYGIHRRNVQERQLGRQYLKRLDFERDRVTIVLRRTAQNLITINDHNNDIIIIPLDENNRVWSSATPCTTQTHAHTLAQQCTDSNNNNTSAGVKKMKKISSKQQAYASTTSVIYYKVYLIMGRTRQNVINAKQKQTSNHWTDLSANWCWRAVAVSIRFPRRV